MKHRRIPGVFNAFEVDDPKEIRALANLDVVDRCFETRTCPLNWLILKRSLSVLSYRGRRFPTMEPRGCASRSLAQDALWRKLNDQIDDVKLGPAALVPLAEWVTGRGSDEEVGLLAQQLLGRLFRDDFTATKASWDAAVILVTAPRSKNLPKLVWWFVTGKVRRAKRVLADLVSNDLSAVNAIGIAVHNLVKSLRLMRSLYAAVGASNTLSPASAAEKCLRAPASVYRQANKQGSLFRTTFAKHSLFVLNIGVASQLPDSRFLVFMEETWSRCPAAGWVPAMLEGVWRLASVGQMAATDTQGD